MASRHKIFTKIVTTLAIVIVVFVFLSLILKLFNVTFDASSGEAIVLAFFGIIATFIVIGNFSQVKEVEERMKEDYKDFKDEIDNRITKKFTEEGDSNDKKMQDLLVTLKRDDLEPIRAKIKKYENDYEQIPQSIKKESDALKSTYITQFNSVLDKLVLLYGDSVISTVIKQTLSKEEQIYKVHVKGQKTNLTYQAVARVNDKNEIEFYKREKDGIIAATPLGEINKINEKIVNASILNAFVSLYQLNPITEERRKAKGAVKRAGETESNTYNK